MRTGRLGVQPGPDDESPPEPPPPPGPPLPPPPLAQGLLASDAFLLADLRYNRLGGPLARRYVQGACVDTSLDLQLQGGEAAFARYLAPHLARRPAFLLQGNPDVEAWAGGYLVAAGKARYGGASSSSDNMCGSYK